MKRISSSLLLLTSLSAVGFAETFDAPVALTDSSANHRLARNSGKVAAFDSAGNLHLSYWIGGEVTNPSSPSSVVYTERDTVGTWSAPVVVDDSFVGPDRVGGRNSVLAVTSDDDVWITWHDHRHGSPAGNWIDNIEIYANRKPSGGSFAASDIRLTETSAAHAGDNGYTPAITALPSGAVGVLWYDFNDGGSVSDVYIRYSDSNGVFNALETLANHRLTNRADRGNSPGYSIPDVTSDSTGRVFGIWTSGFGGAAPVYFAELSNPASTVTESIVATDTGSFFDPAKISVGPDDSLYIVYTKINGADRNVELIWRDSLASSFSAPVVLRGDAGVIERSPALAVDSDGKLHLVYVSGSSPRSVRYARFAAGTFTLETDVEVSTGAGNWERPAIVLDGDERPHVFYEEDINASSGVIWYVAPQNSSIAEWTTF